MRRAVPETCLATGSLRKEGCGVRLDGAPTPRVVVDLDKPGAPLGPGETRCDYLFFAESPSAPGWLAPLELKGGRFQATGVQAQLQAGADAASGLLSQAVAVRFCPIIVSRGTRKNEREKLKRIRIRYRGAVEPVRQMGCDRRLADVLR